MKESILTEKAIRLVKQVFEEELTDRLNLLRVSSPLAIEGHTGINDDLNGIEKPVSFSVRGMNGHKAVVVQSLAKWKRVRLKELEVEPGTGILTDMRALRPDEEFSPIHSIYVDQWDWEKTIKTEERTMRNLKSTVRHIYDALRATEKRVAESLPGIIPVLPDEIEFVHAEELARMYPALSPKERENEYVRNHGAAFIAGIGGILSDGMRHDGRAPDYDDWTTVSEDGFAGLNGDIIVWNPVLESAFEISSMGIRVDRDVLLSQLEQCDCMNRTTLAFHSMLLSGELPPSMGGGIGQSRVCMFMLRKRHIGEVQVGIWPADERARLEREGIRLL